MASDDLYSLFRIGYYSVPRNKNSTYHSPNFTFYRFGYFRLFILATGRTLQIRKYISSRQTVSYTKSSDTPVNYGQKTNQTMFVFLHDTVHFLPPA